MLCRPLRRRGAVRQQRGVRDRQPLQPGVPAAAARDARAADGAALTALHRLGLVHVDDARLLDAAARALRLGGVAVAQLPRLHPTVRAQAGMRVRPAGCALRPVPPVGAAALRVELDAPPEHRRGAGRGEAREQQRRRRAGGARVGELAVRSVRPAAGVRRLAQPLAATRVEAHSQHCSSRWSSANYTAMAMLKCPPSQLREQTRPKVCV